MVAAGCAEGLDPVPRIATIRLASGNDQIGPIGALLSQPLVVRAVDQRGDPVEGAVVEWKVTSGSGVVTPRDTTDADGAGQATLRLGPNLGAQTVTATLLAGNSVSFRAMATAAPASTLAIAGGDNQSAAAGQRLPLELQVRVTDAFNNPKEGVTISFTVLSGGGTVSPASAVSDAAGIAKVSWTLGPVVGSQSVLAGVGTLAPVTFTAIAR